MSSPQSPAAPATGVLLVDDDPLIGELLTDYLEGHGFRLRLAADGTQMRQLLQREAIELVLLDLGLPGEDGLTLVRWLRERWHGAIIIVTGRGEAVDRVVGLELGADDYLAKPFDLRELLARVRAVLRRAQPTVPAASGSLLSFAGFRLDTKARSLRRDGGGEVPLTNGEYELLVASCRRRTRCSHATSCSTRPTAAMPDPMTRPSTCRWAACGGRSSTMRRSPC